MSGNPFSNDVLVPNWTEATRILKDQEGHEFRGNQYTQGLGGHTPAQLDPTRNQVETDRYHGRDDNPAKWTNNSNETREGAIARHDKTALQHSLDSIDTDDRVLRGLHALAAEAHMAASKAHGEREPGEEPTRRALKMSEKAETATKAVNDYIASKRK